MISIESAFVSPSFLCVFVSSQVPSQAGLVFFIVLSEFICHRRFPGRPLASPACSLLECNGHRQKRKLSPRARDSRKGRELEYLRYSARLMGGAGGHGDGGGGGR